MSLAINTVTPEGICLATDSRQSYRNRKGQARIGSDSASKLFKLTDRVGLAVTGPAFLPENGILKNISKFIEDFKRKNNLEKLELKQIANELYSFFDQKYPWKKELEKIPQQIRADLKAKGLEVIEITPEDKVIKFKFKDKKGGIKSGVAGINQLSFILAGYDLNGNHEVYMIYIPGEVQLKRSGKEKGKEYGASWAGQIDVVVRVVLGRDPRISNLLIIQESLEKYGEKKVFKQLGGLEYNISWGTMTLQDAVDFCGLMIQITSAIQRFSDGIIADPGDMPGVGGPADVAVITPSKGFVWVKKKNLRVGDEEIDLDKLPDLPLIKTKKKKNGNKSS